MKVSYTIFFVQLVIIQAPAVGSRLTRCPAQGQLTNIGHALGMLSPLAGPHDLADALIKWDPIAHAWIRLHEKMSK